MSQSMKDLLSNYNMDEPPEIALVKEWVKNRFNADIQVAVSGNQLVLTVPGAALAGSLRMCSYELQQKCAISKRLVIRISA